MRAWFFDFFDVLGAVSFLFAIILFLGGLLARYGEDKHTYNPFDPDIVRQLEYNALQNNKLREAYQFMQGAAIAAMVAFLIFRIIHFKP